jgi:hypothetical protein
MQEVVEVFRIWRDIRGMTFEALDWIAGWPQGYGAKLCAPDPIKNLGWLSLGLGCRALAIKMIIVEDPEQRKLSKAARNSACAQTKRARNRAAFGPITGKAQPAADVER